MKKSEKILKGVALVIVATLFLFIISRIFVYFQNKKDEAIVAKIFSTKLTVDDVMGTRLPAALGADADKTIAGIDANNNGIRDDVELAIFKAYPNGARVRAALLQYAKALQLEVTQPTTNSKMVGAIVGKEDSAFFCITKVVPGDNKQLNMPIIQKYENFVLSKQLNTDDRKKARDGFYEHLASGSLQDNGCDVDLSTLPN